MSAINNRRWLPLNALRAFEAVAKYGSFTAAANALLISQSALSRHVQAIEKQVDIQLFERKPHGLTLTEAGSRLLTAVSKSFDRLEFALADIADETDRPRRILRVHMPPSFASHLAVPIFRDFRREFSEIEIDLVSPYAVGTPPLDVDVAVVYSKPTVTDAVTDLLWPVQLAVLCHPDVAHRHAGAALSDLIEANELIHVRIADLSRHHAWQQFVRHAGVGPVNVERGVVFDTAIMAAQYAMSGEGLALIDPNLFKNDIAEGRLVMPFDVRLDDGYGYYLMTQTDDLSDGAIALFRSWLIRRFSSAAQEPASPVRLIHSVG